MWRRATRANRAWFASERRDRRGGREAGAAGLCGPALALWASAAADYEWPVVEIVDGATLVVDAGADLPPELALLTVRVDGPSSEEYRRNGGDVVSELLAGASSIVIRNPRYGDGDCECQVVVDGESLWMPVLLELTKPDFLPDNRPRPHR